MHHSSDTDLLRPGQTLLSMENLLNEKNRTSSDALVVVVVVMMVAVVVMVVMVFLFYTA